MISLPLSLYVYVYIYIHMCVCVRLCIYLSIYLSIDPSTSHPNPGVSALNHGSCKQATSNPFTFPNQIGCHPFELHDQHVMPHVPEEYAVQSLVTPYQPYQTKSKHLKPCGTRFFKISKHFFIKHHQSLLQDITSVYP